MSSSGAAVGFPGAKADSTGVIRGSTVGEGSCVGAMVAVGAVGAQAVVTKMENKINRVDKSHLFI
jgi:outer membrane lipoprotein SlyB